MTRTLTIAIAFGLLGSIVGAQQAQVQIQNGRVETRAATSLDREITAAGSTTAEAVWVAWREPMIDGARNMCSFYMDRDHPNGVRGDVLDSGINGDPSPPQLAAGDRVPRSSRAAPASSCSRASSTGASNGCTRSATTARSTPTAGPCTG